METTLAIMMVLGIFVGIPAVIGLAIGGAFVVADRRARRAEQTEARERAVAAAEKVVTGAKLQEVAGAVAHQKTRETTKVA